MLSNAALSLLPLLAVSVSAAPSAPSVQVQFANDVTGANGNARIPLDGSAVVLGQAYASTNLARNGTLFVTSLQFTADFSNVACEVTKTDVGKTVASIANFQRDFQRFSQKPLNWQTGFTISCHYGATASAPTVTGTVPTTASTVVPTTVSTDSPTTVSTDSPITTSTDSTTDSTTDSSTDSSTDAPTDAPTGASTDVPTTASTDVPTTASTDAPTDAPTDVPTGTSTDVPTTASTAAPTDVPTGAPTTASTTAPTAPTTVPSAGTVQVQFANDVTGANGNARIPLDGTAVVLGDAYANTNLEKAGTLFVTSLQFTADFSNVACEVVKTDVGKTVASIADFQKDFQRFSQKPLDWQSGFTISCHRA
ncbi:hypothetical protein NQ176_g1544 [Zarea fungicola]|uniref:Uncharacterized protein n=1 Tax=Zarea fungicola TaxID=93591 RepID=A0ACC1NUW6_9HYPO|nr:hypothetical protein NQ176_g1544 [Lecanicillium fungicola]